jgi:hypothetical protein
MTAMKARIAMTMNKGGKIISYQWRQAGWISDIAHTKTITRKKTVCLPFQRNISCPYPANRGQEFLVGERRKLALLGPFH